MNCILTSHSRLSEMRGWTEVEVDAEIDQVWQEHEEEQCLVAWNIFSSPAYVKVHNTS